MLKSKKKYFTLEIEHNDCFQTFPAQRKTYRNIVMHIVHI